MFSEAPTDVREAARHHTHRLVAPRAAGCGPSGCPPGLECGPEHLACVGAEEVQARFFFSGGKLRIPGLHLINPKQREGLVPCVLPRASLWVNASLRFASGAEHLQWQGIPVADVCPSWREETDSALKLVAGNAFTLPVVGWYVLLALVSLIQPSLSRPLATALPKAAAAAAAVGVTTLHLDTLADVLVQVFIAAWPGVITPSEGLPARKVVRLGSLCSGGDFVVPMAVALVAALRRACANIRLEVVQEFDCEADPQMRRVAARRLVQPAREHHHDCHVMPVDAMPEVDLLVFGSVCTSLSIQNRDRRDLLDDSPYDPKCRSGATMQSCLRYVVHRLPAVVIIENVSGLLRVCSNGQRNVDVVLDVLQNAGYTCGYDKVDAQEFMMPQTRQRVYVWAYQATAGAAPWMDVVRSARPGVRIPLEACLLSP